MENKSDDFRFGGNAAQIQQTASFFFFFYTIANKAGSSVVTFGIWGQLRHGAETNRPQT